MSQSNSTSTSPTSDHSLLSLNKNAEPFIPEYIEKENKMFDQLEQEFIKNNPWIFYFDDFVLLDNDK
jgi:hypothetical protein